MKAMNNMIWKLPATASRQFLLAALVAFITLAWSGLALAWDGPGPMVIDHNCTDLSSVPKMWIEAAMRNTRIYYGHASHGKQITEGLRLIEEGDPFFSYEMAYQQLPSDTAALCVNDDHLVNPYHYFLSSGIDRTRTMLDNNPEINISMFMWCDEPCLAAE